MKGNGEQTAIPGAEPEVPVPVRARVLKEKLRVDRGVYVCFDGSDWFYRITTYVDSVNFASAEAALRHYRSLRQEVKKRGVSTKENEQATK